VVKEYAPPPYNMAVMCPECGEKSEVSDGFGLLGGGYGPYTTCDRCGMIVTKTDMSDVEGTPPVIDTTATEVDDGQQGAPPIQDKTSE
jgi:hypothetical protein